MKASVDVLVPLEAPVELLGEMPAGINLHQCPREGRLNDMAARSAFFVPPFASPQRLREMVGQLPNLMVVQTVSAGVDWLVDSIPAGVTLCSGSGAHDPSVAEWVVAAILSAFKQIPEATRQMDAGRWQGLDGLRDVEGATILILGYGSIGAAVEARLLPFGAKILRVARHARDGVAGRAELDEVLPAADVVVNLLPLTPDTIGLLSRNQIGLLRTGALVVNAGRGATIDRDALSAALADGRIRAVLDVTSPEPLPDGDEMWSLPNLLVTQHSAGNTPLATTRMWRMVSDQIARFVAGEPLLNVVTEGY